MKIFKIIIYNIFILIIISLFLEGLSRIFYPEFNNQVFIPKEKSNGKNILMGKYFGHEYRIRSEGDSFNSLNRHLIVIAGDSITRGYGLDYEDIYWVEAERIYNNLAKEKIKIFASPNLGSAVLNLLPKIKILIENIEKKQKIKHFIYQFNYNDIIPAPVIEKANKSFKSTKLNFEFSAFRYGYLNRSTFLRILQYYAGSLRVKTDGNCLERGLDALWRYSWVYGSKVVEEESKQLWIEFEDNLKKLNSFLKEKNIKFSVLIVPTLLQVDPQNLSEKNYLNLDLSCKTLNPTSKLISILKEDKINYVLANDNIKKVFEFKFNNQNSENFFFAGDYNHFSTRASMIVGQDLAEHLYTSSK